MIQSVTAWPADNPVVLNCAVRPCGERTSRVSPEGGGAAKVQKGGDDEVWSDASVTLDIAKAKPQPMIPSNVFLVFIMILPEL